MAHTWGCRLHAMIADEQSEPFEAGDFAGGSILPPPAKKMLFDLLETAKVE